MSTQNVYTFEEALGLSMGWALPKANELVEKFDADLRQAPYQIPEPMPLEWSPEFHGAVDAPNLIDESESFPLSEEQVKYLARRSALIEAINSGLIRQTEVRDEAGVKVLYRALYANGVRAWLAAIETKDKMDLAKRISELEEEVATLKVWLEAERETKRDKSITAKLLKIALEVHHDYWLVERSEGERKQDYIIHMVGKKYGLSQADCQKIERITCPIDRDKSKGRHTPR